MIKFMDEITEVLTGAVRTYMEWVGEIAIYILGLLAKGLILLSTPVWILPYILIRDILRDNNGGKCEKPDCDSCPFSRSVAARHNLLDHILELLFRLKAHVQFLQAACPFHKYTVADTIFLSAAGPAAEKPLFSMYCRAIFPIGRES